MRRLLEVLTATSIPAGGYLALLAMGSMGAAPAPVMSLPEPVLLVEETIWVSLPTSMLLVPQTAPERSQPSELPAQARPDLAAPKTRQTDPPQVHSAALSRSARRSGNRQGQEGGRSGHGADPAPIATNSKVQTKPQSTGKATKCLEPTSAIVQTSAGRFSVERSFLEELAADRAQASELAVMSWHESDGEVDGFRLRRVRCGSPLYVAGFRNGDVIHSVNGLSITSTAEALWAYGALRRESSLKVSLTRRSGSGASMRYQIQ